MVVVDKVVRVISKAHYLLYIAKVGWKGYWPSIGRKYNLSTVHHFLQLRSTFKGIISDIFCMFNYLSKFFTPQVAVKGNIVFAVLDHTAAVRSAAVSVSCLAEEDPNNPPTIPPPKAWGWPDLNIRDPSLMMMITKIDFGCACKILFICYLRPDQVKLCSIYKKSRSSRDRQINILCLMLAFSLKQLLQTFLPNVILRIGWDSKVTQGSSLVSCRKSLEIGGLLGSLCSRLNMFQYYFIICNIIAIYNFYLDGDSRRSPQYYFKFYSFCMLASSPGQLAGECSSRVWADQRRSRETECQESVEGWMQAEKENLI